MARAATHHLAVRPATHHQVLQYTIKALTEDVHHHKASGLEDALGRQRRTTRTGWPILTPGTGADPRLLARQRHAGRGALHHLLLVLPVLFEPELADIAWLRLRPSHSPRRFRAQVPATPVSSHDDSARFAIRHKSQKRKDTNLLRLSDAKDDRRKKKIINA